MSMSQFSRAGEERENLSNHPPRAHTTVKKIASRKSYPKSDTVSVDAKQIDPGSTSYADRALDS